MIDDISLSGIISAALAFNPLSFMTLSVNS
jgi:hypothetical protein